MTPNDLFRFVSLRPAELAESAPAENSPIARRMRDVRRHHTAVLPTLAEVPTTDRAKRISAIKRRRAELVRLINTYEKLQRVVHDTYASATSATGSLYAGHGLRSRVDPVERLEPSATRTSATAMPAWEALGELDTFYSYLLGVRRLEPSAK